LRSFASEQSFEDGGSGLEFGLYLRQVFEALATDIELLFAQETASQILVQAVHHLSQTLACNAESGLKELAVEFQEHGCGVGGELEVIASISGNPDLANGTPSDQLTGAHARARLADFELGGDLIEGERTRGKEE
jgi:hypothetical protein